MKNISVANGKVKITETVESIIELKDIKMQLQSIEKEKIRLIEQNKSIVGRYNTLMAEEAELRRIVGDSPSEDIIVIPEGEINV